MRYIAIILLAPILIVFPDDANSQVDWWPMFHHDLNHTGYSTSIAPNTNQVSWSYRTGHGMNSSPAVADGKVYVGSWDDNVYCLDALNGDSIWSYTTGGNVSSSPAVDDGKVYVGSYDEKVYCLDASNGDFIWSYTTGGWVSSSPAVADGKVYVGSYDEKVYCLDASSGDSIWSYTTGDDVFSSPAVVGGKVYVGSDDNNVYCLDAINGDFIWSYATGYSVWSSPAVANGKVYVGSTDGNVLCFGLQTDILTQSDGFLPLKPTLYQNYPDPFNSSTVIHYRIPVTSDVRMEIFDILGRRVETIANNKQSAGYHQAVWNAIDRSSGMYFYRIQAGDYTGTKKMLLLK